MPKYTYPVDKDGNKINFKTNASQVYDTVGRTVQDALDKMVVFDKDNIVNGDNINNSEIDDISNSFDKTWSSYKISTKIKELERDKVSYTDFLAGRVFKGSCTKEELKALTDMTNGDCWYVTDDSKYYQYSENGWIDVGTGTTPPDLNNSIFKLTNNTGWTTKNLGYDYLVMFNWSSIKNGVSTGVGTCEINIDGTTKKTYSIEQGDNVIDLMPYLNPNDTTQVTKIKISDVYDNSDVLVFNTKFSYKKFETAKTYINGAEELIFADPYVSGTNNVHYWYYYLLSTYTSIVFSTTVPSSYDSMNSMSIVTTDVPTGINTLTVDNYVKGTVLTIVSNCIIETTSNTLYDSSACTNYYSSISGLFFNHGTFNNLTTVTFSNNIKIYYNMSFMFYNCKNLTSINGLNKSICSSVNLTCTFKNCSNLKSIDLSTENYKLGLNASTFYGCKSLTELTLNKFSIELTVVDDSLAGVDKYIHTLYYYDKTTKQSDDLNITTYHFKSLVPCTIPSEPFKKIDGMIMYVPKGCLDVYQRATNWSSYASYMREEP